MIDSKKRIIFLLTLNQHAHFSIIAHTAKHVMVFNMIYVW